MPGKRAIIAMSRRRSVLYYECVEHRGDVSNITGERFHLIGAGGVGMSGLAGLLLSNNAIVTGSDQASSGAVEKLCALGADIKVGHCEDNLAQEAGAVVISAAIKEDNPELKLARAKGLKVYKYAEMLGRLMADYEGIAVSGTHGKSTVSGWLVHCLKRAGVDVNFVVGAPITQLDSSCGAGESKYFVAEACEYDRSFLNLAPKIACILNIEADHLDYYKDEEQIVEAFGDFVSGVRPGGVVIAAGDDANVVKAISKLPLGVRCETFGLGDGCNFVAKNIELQNGLYGFDVYRDGQLLGAAKISLPGRHNVLNALAVIAMGIYAGLEPGCMLELLDGFTGIDRRLMEKDRIGDITVVDDYAHHPTEICACLEALRERYEPKRIWCVFQPHQYSRTRFLLDDFAESFKLADVTIVPEIYFVRDTQQTRKEINAEVLVDQINSNDTKALFIDGFEEICDYLKENVTDGDLVVTMGAGDIWKVADEYIQWLRENR